MTASYDRILRVWDVETGKQIRTFSGHSQSTLAVAADHTGGLLASGWVICCIIADDRSKDKHLRLWDAVSGVCVKTMTALGEITSVEFDSDGKYLLAGCKDNTNRLWDLRMVSVTRVKCPAGVFYRGILFNACAPDAWLIFSNEIFIGILVIKIRQRIS